MKSFVVLTYYQLMHAVACALTLKEKANLYFSQNYLDISEDFLERIRETGLFYKVVGLSQKEYVVPFTEELKKTKGMSEEEIDAIGNSIFEKYLEPHYAELFKDADFDDEIYVYNDFQRHYYYIAKHFKNIIGVEDGYKSLAQQIKVHRFKGNHKLVEPFLGKYYPEPLYKYKNVKKIVSSCDFEKLPEYYREKLEVVDFNDLVEKNKVRFVEILLHIFKLEDLEIQTDSALILGAPLARGKYCNSVQQYLFFQKVIQQAKEDTDMVYIKPHPADGLDYDLLQDEKVVVLPQNFPIEVLGYKGAIFKKSISLSSTAIAKEFSKEQVNVYSGTGSIADIKKFIKTFTEDSRLKLNIYIKVKETTPQTFLAVYGYLKQYQNVSLNIKLLIPQGQRDVYTNYFSEVNIRDRILKYRENLNGNKYRVLYSYEIDDLKSFKWDKLKDVSLEFIEVNSYGEAYLFNEVINKESFDYFILLDSYDFGFEVLKKLIIALRYKICGGYTFLNYTCSSGLSTKKIYLGGRYTQGFYFGTLENRLWHKKMCDEISKIEISSHMLEYTLYKNSEKIYQRAILMLYTQPDSYTSICDGNKYYKERIMECIESNVMDNSKEFLAGRISVLLSE